MNNKKISVITVVKNGMPYLKNAIKSFKLQNYTNKELIIIYSHSYDDTETYLNGLQEKNIIIKKDKESKTRYGSIKKGINSSSGEIFGLLHADDIFYNENVLSKIILNFHDDNDCIYGNILFCNKENFKLINRIWISNKFEKNSLKYGWTPPHTSIFLKKNYFLRNQNIYNEDYKISGDYFFVLKLFGDKGLKSLYINEFITIMRSGGDSTKIKNFLEKFFEDISISKIFFSNYLLCIFLKISRKVKQIKIFKKKLDNDYLNKIQ